MPGWQLGSVALVAARGDGRPLALGEDRRPSRRDDRDRLGGGLRAGGDRQARLRGPGAAPPSRWPRRRPAPARRRLRRLGVGTGEQPKVVATTTADRRFRPRGRRRTRSQVDQILQPNTDPHDYEPRPSDVEGAAGAELVFANGDNLDSWIGKVVSDSGSGAEVVDLGAVVPERLPGESSGAEASTYDPHWWHDPRNAEAAVRQIERSLGRRWSPRSGALFAATPCAYLAKLRALDRGIATLHRLGAARLAQAGHRPRRLRLLRQPLRDRGHRRRHPLADDPGPALRQGPQRPRRPDQARAGEGGLPGELAQPEAGRDDRAARPAPRPTTRSTATRSAPRARAAPPTWGWRRRTPTRWCGASAAAVAAAPIPGSDGRAAGRGRGPRGRLRRRAGDRGRRLPAGAGRAARPARPQRRRQDHAAAGAARGAAGARRRRWRVSARCGDRSRRPSARGSTTRSRRSTSP